MIGPERQGDKDKEDIYLQIARAMFNREKGVPLSENDQVLLGYYGPGGFIDEPENSVFRSKVMLEFDRLSSATNSAVNSVLYPYGHRIPLFSERELQKARDHRGGKKGHGFELKPIPFWPSERDASVGEPMLIRGPDEKIFEFAKELDSRFGARNNQILKAEESEIKLLKKRLREEIGLPVIKKGDAYMGDRFYNFLVKYIVRQDTFGIFKEYLDTFNGRPFESAKKVEEIKLFIGELLGSNFNYFKKYKIFDNFVYSHAEEWGIDLGLYESVRKHI